MSTPTQTQTTPDTATWKGHGNPQRFVYFGRNQAPMPKPVVVNKVKVDGLTLTLLNGTRQVETFQSSRKFWAMPVDDNGTQAKIIRDSAALAASLAAPAAPVSNGKAGPSAGARAAKQAAPAAPAAKPAAPAAKPAAPAAKPAKPQTGPQHVAYVLTQDMTPAMAEYLAWAGGAKGLANLTPAQAFTIGCRLYGKFQAVRNAR